MHIASNAEARELREQLRSYLGYKPWIKTTGLRIGIPTRDIVILARDVESIPEQRGEVDIYPVWLIEEAILAATLPEERRLSAHEFKARWGVTYLAGEEFRKIREQMARIFP